MRPGWRRLVPFPRRTTLRRWFPSFETRNIAHLIARTTPDLLVDLGAGEGQFASRMRAAGLSVPILSVEPLSGVYEALSARAAREPSWRVGPRAAIGAAPGTAEITRYADPTLSSLYAPHPRAVASPALAAVAREPVRVITIDALLAEAAPEARRPFLKLDLQGAELAALSAAPQTLSRAAGVLSELSLTPGYAGEPSYLDVLGALDSAGFVPVYCAQVVARRRLGPWLQMDCLLMRREDI